MPSYIAFRIHRDKGGYVLLYRAVFLIALLLLAGCKINHGLSPNLGTIRGKVIFQHRTSKVLMVTDEIRVAVAHRFPPTEFTELITSPPLPKWEGDTVAYELVVPFGTYQILGVVWKAKGRPWNLSDVMGYYHKGLNLFPEPITVTPEHPVVDSVDVWADFSLVVRDALITGTITYEGAWPPETEIMGIGAFTFVPDPNNIWNLLNVSSAKIGIPIFVRSYEYTLPVSAGIYRYIGLFWKAKGTPLTAIRYLAFYEDPQHPGQPGTVAVSEGDTLRGIDIHVDFSKFQP
jgi:hypothetical protein